VVSRVQKWGNSLAVRIPKSMAEDLEIGENAMVNQTLENGSLVMSPDRQKRHQLADMLDRFTPDNVHAEVEGAGLGSWTYLVERNYSWKKQLFIKGRRLTAAQVWLDMRANDMTLSAAAENWDLPEEAVAEIVEYCESNAPLLKMEADEERLFLSSQGVKLAP